MTWAARRAPGAWVITGAASGFGREFAVRLARRGEALALLDRDEEGLAHTRSLVPGAKVHAVTVDLTDEDAVGRAVAASREALGPLANLVHSAGILRIGSVEETPTEVFRALIDVNYLGTVKVTRAMLPHLRESARNGRSTLLLIASVAGLRAAPEVGAYSASKFAVVGFAQALRDELHGTNVDVRALCPPAGDTPMVRNLPRLPKIYAAVPRLSAQRIVARALDAIEKPGFIVLVDAQSRALLALDRVSPSLGEYVVSRIVRR